MGFEVQSWVSFPGLIVNAHEFNQKGVLYPTGSHINCKLESVFIFWKNWDLFLTFNMRVDVRITEQVLCWIETLLDTMFLQGCRIIWVSSENCAKNKLVD